MTDEQLTAQLWPHSYIRVEAGEKPPENFTTLRYFSIISNTKFVAFFHFEKPKYFGGKPKYFGEKPKYFGDTTFISYYKSMICQAKKML